MGRCVRVRAKIFKIHCRELAGRISVSSKREIIVNFSIPMRITKDSQRIPPNTGLALE